MSLRISYSDISTVRCGAESSFGLSHGAVRCRLTSHGAVRWGASGAVRCRTVKLVQNEPRGTTRPSTPPMSLSLSFTSNRGKALSLGDSCSSNNSSSNTSSRP